MSQESIETNPEIVEVEIQCPCCEMIFTGTGFDGPDARNDAKEKLQSHLDLEEC